ncbi:MAG: N-acetylmuramoyl-L-alanine amidase [Porticoccaceae bacterium]|nr:N-acetylmuramoyl-L-alanine amidase [Porticoccaceae bacterium]
MGKTSSDKILTAQCEDIFNRGAPSWGGRFGINGSYYFHAGVIIRLLLAIYLLGASHQIFATAVEGIRLWRAPDHTRLVFDLSAPVEHKVFALDNPHRLVIDVVGASSSVEPAGLNFIGTPIKGIRTAVRDARDLRVVLDLTGLVSPRSFSLGRNEQYGDRLVVDLYGSESTVSKTVEDVVKSSGKLREVIIAIDAGHGGDDPGAIGPGKIYEKKVALAISRELKKLADAESGFRGVLVRTGDYYVPLRKRTDIARKSRADVFVSIHADAFKQASVHGASVYALSSRGATSETARYIAQRENRADLIGGVGSVSLNDKDVMLASVLLDLSMTSTLDSSLEIGARVLKSMGALTRLHKKRVEQAGFMVLKAPDVPSILVETGFISNPTEARRLNQRGHQRKMANAIFKGIKEHFKQSPPEGSLLASLHKKFDSVYIVTNGDTLSQIAHRHQVSVKAIQRHNKLTSTSIRVGQRIKIPLSS